jgi:hypothetical protein
LTTLVADAGLPVGAVVPEFQTLEVPSGREVRFPADHERDKLLVIVASNCGHCARVFTALESGRYEWQPQADLTIVFRGDEAAARRLRQETGTSFPLLIDPRSRIQEGFGEPPVPFAFLIDTSGTVRSKGLARNEEDIRRIIGGQTSSQNGQEVDRQVEVSRQSKGESDV